MGRLSFNKSFKLCACLPAGRLYAFSLPKHPIQDPVRIYIEGCENGQTLATGCFKVTTRLPSWHGGWFIFTSHCPIRRRYEVFLKEVLCA